MRGLLERLFPTMIYTDALQQRRAAGTYLVVALVLLGLVAATVNILILILMGQTAEIDAALMLRGAVLLGVALSAYLLTRRRQQELGATILLLAWFAMLFFATLSGVLSVEAGFAGMLVGISLGALLIGDWTVFYATAIALLYLLYGLSLPNASRTILFVSTPILFVHAGVNYAMARNLRTITKQIAANVEARSLRLSKASGALVGRLLAARLDLNVMLEETVKLVRDSFPNVDDARLFLVDKERKNATLVASTGASDQALIGRQQIGVGSLSVIGRVTISGQGLVVRDTADEQAYRRSSFLEGTRAELVIPLRVGDETIGALDAQSKQPDAFSPDDVETLETLANQIAVAIDNARLYAEAQAKLTENQRLYEQTSANLREIERLNQQLTGGAWSEYLRGMGLVPAFTLDLVSGRVENAAEWTPTLSEASRRNQVVVRGTQLAKTVALPITVRGQVIGAMEFELAPDQHVGPEQMVILQQVIERLGLAAENVRLLDEAQRIAQREAMVNEITARMQAATNVEAVVAAATQSLADAFQAPRVAIRLGTPTSGPAASPDTSTNGKHGKSG